MNKHFLSLLLIVPALAFCQPEPQGQKEKEEKKEEYVDPAYAKAAPEVKDGDTVLATNANVEKFLTEVNYSDTDYSSTVVLNYEGGFNSKNPAPKGTVNSDRPKSYSVRWKENMDAGKLMFHLEDKLGWSRDLELFSGTCYVDITNLVPNDTYTYSVVGQQGDTLTKGKFNTTGHLHQIFFRNGCRNGRDLGGWTGLNGKTVKYRRIYRGGRMQSDTVNDEGKVEIKAEGIAAQLDLRGTSDVLGGPAIKGFEFCAPVIETGGPDMLTVEEGAKTKACVQFVINSLKANKPVYFHCSLGRDRTGTMGIILLGLLGVRPGDISKEYEVTYFAPMGYSISSSESSTVFQNTRDKWVFKPTAEFFWTEANKAKAKGKDGSFADGVENYLLGIGISQDDIDWFRNEMLVD
ncbi:MAG: tyrosine-protein phosphatase [Bacteroidales bacterium]|nr:tyrosine-protein phosphatase [Bacteroidales bacterium]